MSLEDLYDTAFFKNTLECSFAGENFEASWSKSSYLPKEMNENLEELLDNLRNSLKFKIISSKFSYQC